MNCNPGQLAIVISDEEIENIGKIGQVIRPSLRMEEHGFDIFRWAVAFKTPLLTIDGGSACLVSIKDSCLKPVSGLPMEEETQETIKEKA